MNILQLVYPNVKKFNEYSPSAYANNLVGLLQSNGHNSYLKMDSGEDDEYDIHVATAMVCYRDYGYDIVHFHVSKFSAFQKILKYARHDDRIVVTLHIPVNIGKSFYYYQDAAFKLLQDYPYFRLVCVGDQGSYRPLMKVLDQYKVEGVDSKIAIISNAIKDPGLPLVPHENRLNRFIAIAHMVPTKNVHKILQLSVNHSIPCMYIGRRVPHRKISRTDEEYAQLCEEMIRNNANLIDYREVLTNQECLEEIAKSRALVSFSESEACATVPIESAFVGTPVIWTDCPGVDDTMLDGVTGYRITRTPQTRTWKQKLAAAAEKYSLATGLSPQGIRDHVCPRLEFRVEALKYIPLYQGMMQ